MLPEHFPKEPKALWENFYKITQVPRPSKQEEKATELLISIANESGLKWVKDNVGNIIIYVPGKGKKAGEAPLIIQNHIDMVTDALHGVKINFALDPIKTIKEGEWLKAQGTTLGADNGIGCAAALATIFEKDLIHPPLELLFTIDEETGLNGALGLETKYLSGRRMLNLDTEEWGSLYIGCAGGIDYELTKEVRLNPALEGSIPVKILVDQFIGGHSGVDIHEQRGNAIKFLAEFLIEARKADLNFEIAELRAGKAHNIIPRDAFIHLWIEEIQKQKFLALGESLIQRWKSFLPKEDQALRFSLFEEEGVSNQVLSSKDCKDLINYLVLFPHGAHAYDLNNENLVSMSNNLAKFLIVNGKVYTQSSLRFFDREEVKSLENQLYSLGGMFGMKVENHSEYPSWKPVWENSILDLVKNVYADLYGEEAHVTAIHAGLECGILRDKIGPIDVLSFGPTIMGAHSPDERVHIPSVEKFWLLFKTVLERI